MDGDTKAELGSGRALPPQAGPEPGGMVWGGSLGIAESNPCVTKAELGSGHARRPSKLGADAPPATMQQTVTKAELGSGHAAADQSPKGDGLTPNNLQGGRGTGHRVLFTPITPDGAVSPKQSSDQDTASSGRAQKDQSPRGDGRATNSVRGPGAEHGVLFDPLAPNGAVSPKQSSDQDTTPSGHEQKFRTRHASPKQSSDQDACLPVH